LSEYNKRYSEYKKKEEKKEKLGRGV